MSTTGSATTSQLGNNFTINGAVARTGGAGAAPNSGNITFILDGYTGSGTVPVPSTFCVGAVSGGTASCSAGSDLPVGSYTFHAEYQDTLTPQTYNSSVQTSASLGHTINASPYTMTIASATGETDITCAAGASVTCTGSTFYARDLSFRVSVTATNPGVTVPPSGTLSVAINGTGSGSQTIAAAAPSQFTLATRTTDYDFTVSNPGVLTAGASRTVTVTYAGDSNYLSSNNAVATFTVLARPTTLVVTRPTPATGNTVSGETATFLGTLTRSTALAYEGTGVTALNGTITLSRSGGGGTFAHGGHTNVGDTRTRQATVSNLAVGASTITAAVTGLSTNYAAPTVTNFNHTVDQAPTTTVVELPGPTAPVGTNVALVARVTPAPANNNSVSGTVTFHDNSTSPPTLLGTITRGGGGGNPPACATGLASCTFTLNLTNLAVGTHPITATYAGNTQLLGSNSNASPQTIAINQVGVSIAIVSSPSPSVFGSEVAFTVTTTATSGGSPTGTVELRDGTADLGTVTLASTGANTAAGTFRTSSLSAGEHTIFASYAGDANHPAGSGSGSHTVNVAPTVITIASDVNPSVVGQSVTFTANVTTTATGAGTIPGTVTFKDGGTTLGTGTLASGVATFSTTELSVGPHSISAEYTAQPNFGESTTITPVSQTVNKAATSLEVSSSSNPGRLGTEITLTATLSVTAPGGGVPTGSVLFVDTTTNTSLGTGTIGANGAASVQSSTLTDGVHNISVSYAGDESYNGSTGTFAQTMSANAATVTVTTATSPSKFGESVTLEATVTGDPTTPPTGSVTFTAPGVILNSGNAIPLVDGKATTTTLQLPVGTTTITAQYSGDGAHSAGSGSVTHTVTKGDVTFTLTSEPAGNASVGQNIVFTGTFSANPGTGEIEAFNGATSLGKRPFTGGTTATFSASDLPVGTHQISAKFLGNANVNEVTSNTLTITVAEGSTSSSTSSSSGTSGTTSSTSSTGGASSSTSSTTGGPGASTTSSTSGTVNVGGGTGDDDGCNTAPSGSSTGAATFLVAAAAVVIARRRRRSA
ncbi:MAG: Ig-like domain repeat protein [Labilithrix sp.]|nr:Ig-like domain repeat protein [Labilithrix sp.]